MKSFDLKAILTHRIYPLKVTNVHAGDDFDLNFRTIWSKIMVASFSFAFFLVYELVIAGSK